jgi:hypothetical protein
MIPKQEAIALLPSIDQWEELPGLSPRPPILLAAIALREYGDTSIYHINKVLEDCNGLFAEAYRELIRAGKV